MAKNVIKQIQKYKKQLRTWVTIPQSSILHSSTECDKEFSVLHPSDYYIRLCLLCSKEINSCR